MEVAGVVLGALPIALYALDNYNRCLQATKDIVKYQATLEQFRLHIFIQQAQLEITLRNLGLHCPEGQLPKKSDLQRRLEQVSPHGYANFMGIILRMENLLEKLLDKLELDAKGKPKWTNEPLENVLAWEWRRVKRGLSGSKRRELVQELQQWNTALSKVFEKREIPAIQSEDDIDLQKPQFRFDASACNLIRNNANSVHHAFARLWQCNCAEHRISLVASWRLDVNKTLEPEPFTLAVQSRDGTWKSLSVAVEKEASKKDSLTPSQASQVQSTLTLPRNISNSKIKKKNRRLVRFWSSSKDSSALTSDIVPMLATSQVSMPLQPKSQETLHHITCLCTFVSPKTTRFPSSGLVRLEEQDLVDSQSSSHNIFIRCVQDKGTTGNINVFSVADCLASSLESPKLMSRRQRFSIAAAATSAVLYLCGTRWLEENGHFCSRSDSINLFVPTLITSDPNFGISCAFKSESRHTIEDKSDILPTNFRCKILFALGVLLIELCLNKTLESIREQEQNRKGKGKATESGHLNSVILDDLELVERVLLDQVYLEAGNSYGWAVQRCVRCEFPGIASTKSFEFQKFRELFFKGVVVPVHETLDSMQVV
ncbi:hypothetical protein QBC43DRAFT_310323 [Cladorrhinum sp. PSN259]|nr:hypothetical protein QBC43DRAFT_310323 [Cladorrhinum sp. PSN259]